jgi:hypothetical protein
MVFVLFVAAVDAVACLLETKGHKVARYHGQLSNEGKQEALTSWTTGSTHIMVSTEALAMGIDYPSVRQVYIHFTVRKVELLVQMAGRAGRDGKGGLVKLIFPFYPPAIIKDEDPMVFIVINKELCLRQLLYASFDSGHIPSCLEVCQGPPCSVCSAHLATATMLDSTPRRSLLWSSPGASQSIGVTCPPKRPFSQAFESLPLPNQSGTSRQDRLSASDSPCVSAFDLSPIPSPVHRSTVQRPPPVFIDLPGDSSPPALSQSVTPSRTIAQQYKTPISLIKPTDKVRNNIARMQRVVEFAEALQGSCALCMLLGFEADGHDISTCDQIVTRCHKCFSDAHQSGVCESKRVDLQRHNVCYFCACPRGRPLHLEMLPRGSNRCSSKTFDLVKPAALLAFTIPSYKVHLVKEFPITCDFTVVQYYDWIYECEERMSNACLVFLSVMDVLFPVSS